MRILIDTGAGATPPGVDLHIRVGTTPGFRKPEVVHEAEQLPPLREQREVIAAALYSR